MTQMLPAALTAMVVGLGLFGVFGVVCWRALWNGRSLERALGSGLVAGGGAVLMLGGFLAVYWTEAALAWGAAIWLVTIVSGVYLLAKAGPSPQMSPPQLAARRRRVMARTGPLGIAALLAAMLGMPALAYVANLEGDVQHTFIASLPTDDKGAYLITTRGAMKLYDWYAKPPEFPSDAPTLARGEVQEIAVVQKQFDVIDKYPLFSLTTGARVQWARWEKKGTQLFLDPLLPLPSGDYVFVRSTDSPDGESTIHYFRIR